MLYKKTCLDCGAIFESSNVYIMTKKQYCDSCIGLRNWKSFHDPCYMLIQTVRTSRYRPKRMLNSYLL